MPGRVRRAAQGHVFVVVELQADSRNGIGGVHPGDHVVITGDGAQHLCQTDAPDAYGEATVVDTASCAVPVSASSFVFQMTSDQCEDGCTTVDHQIAIDPSFTEVFESPSSDSPDGEVPDRDHERPAAIEPDRTRPTGRARGRRDPAGDQPHPGRPNPRRRRHPDAPPGACHPVRS